MEVSSYFILTFSYKKNIIAKTMRRRERKPMPNGRPPKYSDPSLFQKKINEYFENCDKRTEKVVTKDGAEFNVPSPEPYTIAGLALFLGFEDRGSFYDYCYKNKFSSEDIRAKFSYALKKARLKVEQDLLKRCVESGKPVGCIFILKNHFDYRDKVETETTLIEPPVLNFYDAPKKEDIP